MLFRSFNAVCGIITFLSFSALVSSQSVDGGSFFKGAGVPGSASYALVDDYEPALFFDKFNYYDVCTFPTWPGRAALTLSSLMIQPTAMSS